MMCKDADQLREGCHGTIKAVPMTICSNRF